MKKKKVIAAGHICLDITPVFPDAKTGRLEDVLSPGKLVEMKEADVEKLMEVPEIPEHIAEGIYRFFHSDGQ